MSAPTPRTVTVMVVGPSTRCDVLYARADYREWNRLVGSPTREGSISLLRIPQELRERHFAAYCDDEALLHDDQPPNHFAPQLGHFRLHGPALFFRDEGDGDEHSLSPSDVQFLASYLAHRPTLEAEQDWKADRAFWEAHPSGQAIVEFGTLGEMLAYLGLEDDEE